MVDYFRSMPNPNASFAEFIARGDVEEKPAGATYNTNYHPSAYIALERGWHEYGSRTDSDTDWIQHNMMAKPGDQLKLFDTHPSKIHSAFTDHRMRAYTPTVLGMAINEAKKIGTGLTYSDNLSVHSAKLAKKGKALGVVSTNRYNPDANATNDIAEDGLDEHTHVYSTGWFQDFVTAKPEEVKAGRETIRGIVNEHRQAKKTHMGPQFENTNPGGWYQPELGQ